MNFNFLNLVMAAFWLLVAVMIFAFSQNLLGPADQAPKIPWWAGLVAIGGVVYNFFRWRHGYSSSQNPEASRVNPLAVRRLREEGNEPYEKNPDFDFIKLPDAESPSRNGDHHAGNDAE